MQQTTGTNLLPETCSSLFGVRVLIQDQPRSTTATLDSGNSLSQLVTPCLQRFSPERHDGPHLLTYLAQLVLCGIPGNIANCTGTKGAQLTEGEGRKRHSREAQFQAGMGAALPSLG
jgi:hypothetical protein